MDRCFIEERMYDQNGRLHWRQQISGQIQIKDWSYAKQRMESLFQYKIVEFRNIVIPRSLCYGPESCSMQLKTGVYEIALVKI